MRTSIVAVLMAAASLIPGTAMAQRGDEDRGRFDRTARGAASENRRPVEQDRPDRGVQPDRPQARSDRGGDGWRGDRADRGGFRGDSGRGAGDRGGDGRWRGDGRGNAQWQRNDAGRSNAQWQRNDAGRNNAQWRGNDDRVRWRGDDRVGAVQWRGDDRRADLRGNQGNWNRGWRQDNRYDWNRRRQVNRNAFHLPRYHAPSGWGYGYRRFDVGITLNAGLFDRSYWIDDAYGYGLPDAYGPYRWVRYYNDALLVDVYGGQVVDTVYDIFW